MSYNGIKYRDRHNIFLPRKRGLFGMDLYSLAVNDPFRFGFLLENDTSGMHDNLNSDNQAIVHQAIRDSNIQNNNDEFKISDSMLDQKVVDRLKALNPEIKDMTINTLNDLIRGLESTQKDLFAERNKYDPTSLMTKGLQNFRIVVERKHQAGQITDKNVVANVQRATASPRDLFRFFEWAMDQFNIAQRLQAAQDSQINNTEAQNAVVNAPERDLQSLWTEAVGKFSQLPDNQKTFWKDPQTLLNGITTQARTINDLNKQLNSLKNAPPPPPLQSGPPPPPPMTADQIWTSAMNQLGIVGDASPFVSPDTLKQTIMDTKNQIADLQAEITTLRNVPSLDTNADNGYTEADILNFTQQIDDLKNENDTLRGQIAPPLTDLQIWNKAVDMLGIKTGQEHFTDPKTLVARLRTMTNEINTLRSENEKLKDQQDELFVMAGDNDDAASSISDLSLGDKAIINLDNAAMARNEAKNFQNEIQMKNTQIENLKEQQKHNLAQPLLSDRQIKAGAQSNIEVRDLETDIVNASKRVAMDIDVNTRPVNMIKEYAKFVPKVGQIKNTQILEPIVEQLQQSVIDLSTHKNINDVYPMSKTAAQMIQSSLDAIDNTPNMSVDNKRIAKFTNLVSALNNVKTRADSRRQSLILTKRPLREAFGKDYPNEDASDTKHYRSDATGLASISTALNNSFNTNADNKNDINIASQMGVNTSQPPPPKPVAPPKPLKYDENINIDNYNNSVSQLLKVDTMKPDKVTAQIVDSYKMIYANISTTTPVEAIDSAANNAGAIMKDLMKNKNLQKIMGNEIDDLKQNVKLRLSQIAKNQDDVIVTKKNRLITFLKASSHIIDRAAQLNKTKQIPDNLNQDDDVDGIEIRPSEAAIIGFDATTLKHQLNKLKTTK